MTIPKALAASCKARADAKALSEVAHSFKGSGGNMGAVRLAELCQELEIGRQRQEPSQNNVGLVAEISGEFAIVRPCLRKQRQHVSPH